MAKKYAAYVQKMRMYEYDEKYTQEFARDDWDDWANFDSYDDAVTWVKNTHAQMVKDGEDYEVTRTKHGLDYIEYHDYGVIPYEVVDDEKEYDYDHDEIIETMPDELRDSIEKSQRSYHKFLDHEQGHYVGVTDLMA